MAVVSCGMQHIFAVGDTTSLSFKVQEADLAAFNGVRVHPFYSTFALGRDVEWTCRQFVLEMKDPDEEGIGTFLNIKHQSPALLNETVCITAVISRLQGNQIDCDFEVRIGDRIIASGQQGQRILKKDKIKSITESIAP